MPHIRTNRIRTLYNMLLDKGILSYGPARAFYGPSLAAILPDPLDLTDLSWLPEIGHDSDLGRTQGITLKRAIAKMELKTADDGERPADKAIQSDMISAELALADAGIVKIAEAVQGVENESYDSGRFKGTHLTNRLFQRDSQIVQPFLMRLYRDGVLSDRPSDNLLMYRGAASTEDSENAYTSGDQRVYPVSFLFYVDPDRYILDGTRRVTLHGSFLQWLDESESEV